MSQRKPLTDEQLDAISKEMLKPDAKKQLRLDRSVWKPCRRCKTCQSCKSSICGLDDKSSECYDCDNMGNYEPMGFCPWCGRPLTDAAWKMLERRIGGCKMSAIKEAAVLQEKYQSLVYGKKLSKREMFELCVTFRDKYGLTDLQTLRIARKEMELSEMIDLLEQEALNDEQQ